MNQKQILLPLRASFTNGILLQILIVVHLQSNHMLSQHIQKSPVSSVEKPSPHRLGHAVSSVDESSLSVSVQFYLLLLIFLGLTSYFCCSSFLFFFVCKLFLAIFVAFSSSAFFLSILTLLQCKTLSSVMRTVLQLVRPQNFWFWKFKYF